MKLEEMEDLFDKYGEQDEYLEFNRIENKLSQRPDLHAFILLDKLVPGNMDIVSGAEHDEFYLEVDPKEFAKVATEENILELVRCGVSMSLSYGCFSMFL